MRRGEERTGDEKKGNEKKGKERRGFVSGKQDEYEKKMSGPLGLLITLYAVKIFDAPRLLMSGAMKNA